MKTLELVRSRIEDAIASEEFAASVLDEGAERYYEAYRKVRSAFMALPTYTPDSEAGKQLQERQETWFDMVRRANSRRREAAAYRRLLAKVFGDSTDGGAAESENPT